jgi:hypothetical protein
MQLDGAEADTQMAGYGLVWLAGGHQFKYLTPAGRQ